MCVVLYLNNVLELLFIVSPACCLTPTAEHSSSDFQDTEDTMKTTFFAPFWTTGIVFLVVVAFFFPVSQVIFLNLVSQVFKLLKRLLPVCMCFRKALTEISHELEEEQYDIVPENLLTI